MSEPEHIGEPFLVKVFQRSPVWSDIHKATIEVIEFNPEGEYGEYADSDYQVVDGKHNDKIPELYNMHTYRNGDYIIPKDICEELPRDNTEAINKLQVEIPLD